MNGVMLDDLKALAARADSQILNGFRGMKLFLTGGTGFLGQWITESFLYLNELAGMKSNITLLVRQRSALKITMPHLFDRSDVTIIEGDLSSLSDPPGVFSHLIHAAIGGSTKVLDANEFLMDNIILGTRSTLNFAKKSKVNRFLLISSGGVYGRQPRDMEYMPEHFTGTHESMAYGYPEIYGISKRAAELLCTNYWHYHGIETVVARCFSFVGPHLPMQKNFAIGNFIHDATHGQTIKILGDGTPIRTYLYTADLALALWRLLFSGRAGEAYNVGSEFAISISDLATQVQRILNPNVEIAVSKIPNIGTLPERYVPALNKYKSEFGPIEFVTLESAIAKTAKWYRN